MSYFFKNIQPGYGSESEEDALEDIIKGKLPHQTVNDSESSDDELKSLSFGSIKKADTMLSEKENFERKIIQPKKTYKEESFEEEEEGSESESNSDDGDFFEEEGGNRHSRKHGKKGKHAPKEHSSKKRVSKVREIAGLNTSSNRNSNLYQDIRFDKSTGEPQDKMATRRNYQFLDDYRQNEIQELQSLLKDRKFLSKVSSHEVEEMEESLKSMKSKLQSLKNRDLEHKIIKDYEKDINKDNKTKFHLKKNDRRKVIQKWKFDHMKSKQREKVMERKRKKRLGKEFKQFEFHKST